MNEQPLLQRSPTSFTTTHWSVVLAARDSESHQAGAALDSLCRTYWYPLYACVRRQGHDEESAKDLIQEFFHRFLQMDSLASVAPEKGKFRSFLLASLKNFLSVARVRESAIKRGGRQTFVPLEDSSVEERYLSEPQPNSAPESIYDYGWATTVMERALKRLREEFQREGKIGQFQHLKVFMSREPAEGEYAKVAAASNSTVGAVGVAVHRLRQRFGQYVRREVADTVADPDEVEEELRYLFAVLTAG